MRFGTAVFEFMSTFIMRRRQYELVTAFMVERKDGRSSVQQMIMGAGKTTVICPVLAMMLADGESLVTQVAPGALLEMSRSVLRAVFSCVIFKNVITLTFDRSSDTSKDPAAILRLRSFLDRARSDRSIVVSTPESIKSLMLQYVDMLQAIESASNPDVVSALE
jgi:hypothetical protein